MIILIFTFNVTFEMYDYVDVWLVMTLIEQHNITILHCYFSIRIMRLWKDPETGTTAGGHSRWKTGVMSKSSGSDYFSRNNGNRGDLPAPPGFGSGSGAGTGTGGGDRNSDVGKKEI